MSESSPVELAQKGFDRWHDPASREVAEVWDGHSGGIADHYDDGIFLPVIEAQRKFADELRPHGML